MIRVAVTRAVAVAATLFAACAVAEEPGPTVEGRPLALTATPTLLGPARFGPGVDLLGAWVLSASDPDFGGISGLLIEGTALTAVTDRGRWLTARLESETPELISDARIARMRHEDGRPLEGRQEWDAEGLTRLAGQLVVSFEQDHRLMLHLGGGRLGQAFTLMGVGALPSNAGLEGLAALPDGRLLAIAEGRDGDAFPFWVVGPAQGIRGVLPARSKHDVTAADIGPDGRLYLVQRHYSRAEGVSIRVLRYLLGEGGTPVAGSAVELAAFDALSGIDNMEGIAAVGGPDGLTLWIVSDDNFNPPQRNLLVALTLDR